MGQPYPTKAGGSPSGLAQSHTVGRGWGLWWPIGGQSCPSRYRKSAHLIGLAPTRSQWRFRARPLDELLFRQFSGLGFTGIDLCANDCSHCSERLWRSLSVCRPSAVPRSSRARVEPSLDRSPYGPRTPAPAPAHTPRGSGPVAHVPQVSERVPRREWYEEICQLGVGPALVGLVEDCKCRCHWPLARSGRPPIAACHSNCTFGAR
jgi:hypothetical protein